MRPCAIAFSSVVRTCSCPISSAKDCGLYFLAITWYMEKVWAAYARPRVIRGTRAAPLPLLPSGPGGVHGCPLHGARSLTTSHANTRGRGDRVARRRRQNVPAGGAAKELTLMQTIVSGL